MRRSNGAECIQSEKACYEAAIPSEVKPTKHQEMKSKQKREGRDSSKRRASGEAAKRRSSEAVRIQSKKVCYEAVIQSEAKPTLPQEEKEQAQETDRQKEIDREQ
jgi:hypothetical protein